MQAPERMQRIVSTACSEGVGLHLDDFGTEYSSLAALLQFPVVALKIDRSFVTSLIGRGGRSEAIVRGAIALAHGLGLRAIAEGIEHPVELDCLRALDCDRGQGFLFSRPLDTGQTQAPLAGWTPLRVAELSDQLASGYGSRFPQAPTSRFRSRAAGKAMIRAVLRMPELWLGHDRLRVECRAGPPDRRAELCRQARGDRRLALSERRTRALNNAARCREPGQNYASAARCLSVDGR